MESKDITMESWETKKYKKEFTHYPAITVHRHIF